MGVKLVGAVDCVGLRLFPHERVGLLLSLVDTRRFALRLYEVHLGQLGESLPHVQLLFASKSLVECKLCGILTAFQTNFVDIAGCQFADLRRRFD